MVFVIPAVFIAVFGRKVHGGDVKYRFRRAEAHARAPCDVAVCAVSGDNFVQVRKRTAARKWLYKHQLRKIFQGRRRSRQIHVFAYPLPCRDIYDVRAFRGFGAIRGADEPFVARVRLPRYSAGAYEAGAYKAIFGQRLGRVRFRTLPSVRAPLLHYPAKKAG